MFHKIAAQFVGLKRRDKPTHTKKEDMIMMQEIAERNPAAFAAFYDRHAKFVFSFLNRLLKNRIESEDLLQDIFWQIWQQAGKYDSQFGSPAAWICALARRRGISRLVPLLRRRQRDAHLEPLPSDQVPNIKQHLQGEVIPIKKGMGQALFQIPKDQQEPIILAFFEGLTHEEIAIRLQMPIGIVKSKIRLGMNSLNVILQEKEETSR